MGFGVETFRIRKSTVCRHRCFANVGAAISVAEIGINDEKLPIHLKKFLYGNSFRCKLHFGLVITADDPRDKCL